MQQMRCITVGCESQVSHSKSIIGTLGVGLWSGIPTGIANGSVTGTVTGSGAMREICTVA